VLSGETTNTNFIVFGLTQSGLDPKIYRPRGEQANHYTIDVVESVLKVSTYIITCRTARHIRIRGTGDNVGLDIYNYCHSMCIL
jgi:hypothetical protein